MHKFTRNALLITIGLIAASGIGFKLADKPQPISAQVPSPTVVMPPGKCGDTCVSDTDCYSQKFCHSTINWENWQAQTIVLNQVGSGQITGWNTHYKPNDDPIYHAVRGGKVYTNHLNNWDSGNDFSSCFGNASGQCGTLTTSRGTYTNLTNPIVGYNTVIRTENGVQVLITQLVRYREIYEMKSNYLTGATISPWTKTTVLDSLLTTYGGTWDQWAFLSFDSSYAYEDGRQQQRLIIGKVDDRGTTTVNDDRIYDTKMITRLNVRNADGNFTWSPWILAAHTTNNTSTQGLGGNGAQGSLISYDNAYNLDTATYMEAIVRWYWNGSSYVAQVWHREAFKRANTQKECRSIVYPQSCTMPGYVPVEPTNTPFTPPPSDSDIPTPQNLSANVTCTAGKATFSWTLPTNQSSYQIGATVFEYCLKNTNSQTTCSGLNKLELPHVGLASQLSRDVALSNMNLSKGQTALVRLRLSPQSVPAFDLVGNPSAYISVKYSGPVGDFDNNCTVSISDYNDIKFQYLTPSEIGFNIITSNHGLFLINQTIRNFNLSN
jgi:hypothetical protein